MKRFILVFILLAVSAGAQAEWVPFESSGHGYIWYPVEQYYPFAYPLFASVNNPPRTVTGWKYRSRSMLSEITIDCRDGRTKLRRATVYTGRYLTGSSVRVGWLTLSNGLKVVPGRWYGYSRLPSLAQEGIAMACD